MANRFPLIANSSDSKIYELPSGDNLDLTGSGIYNGTATITLPTVTSTLATLAGTETLTNKTLSLPTFSAVGGDEGGEVRFALAASNTTLTTSVTVDIYQNQFRIFETGGTVRGVTLDLSAASAGVGSTLITNNGTQTLTNKTVNLSSNTLTGTIAQFNTALSDADFATLAGTETLTNKTINLSNNTLTGTIAQFNTALSDADFATLAGTETFTNKTLTSPTLTTPVLGTPASGTLTNCTGLPVATGISGLGTGVATFLATPSSANFAAAITDETGSGSLVFSASPTFTGTANFAAISTSGNTAVGGNLTVTGDLTVNGTTTTVNSTTITVDDKNIELGSVATPTDTTADGGGITLKGATDKTINWVNATSAWTSSEDFNLLTGKVYEIAGTSVLSATTLGSGVVNSSLTSVGTIATGTWQGTVIGSTYGGTGVNNGGRTITLNTGNLTLTAQAGGSSVTIPSSGTLVSSADTGTVTSTMIADGTIVNADINASAAIAVSKLAASTISGITLGNNLNALTIGTGLSGTSYNGSSAVTIAIDSTVVTLSGTQTLTNKTLTSPTLTTPVLGTPSSGTLTNCTGLPLSTGVTGTLPVANGGTGASSQTAYAVLCGGTTSTGAFQSVVSVGTSGQVLTSNGAGALPTFQTFTVPNASTQVSSLGVGTAASGTTGEIRATNAITSYYSDERLKKDITEIDGALDKVMQLKGVTFRANDLAESYGYTSDKEQVGVIAQDVEKVLPQVVVPAPFDVLQLQEGVEISRSGENYKTVHYEKLVPLLIQAIKEQQVMIEELKKKVGI